MITGHICNVSLHGKNVGDMHEAQKEERARGGYKEDNDTVVKSDQWV